MSPSEPTTAVIYARVSKNRDDDRAKPDRQIDACRARADAAGLTVLETCVDDDVSAYKGSGRPQYDAMLERLRTGNVGTVVAWHTDRLHRNTAEALQFFTLCKELNVNILTVQSGDVDMQTASGKLMFTILAAMAENESQHKSERHILRNEQARQSGLSTGGPFPFGWGIPEPVMKQDGTPELTDTGQPVMRKANIGKKNPQESELIKTATKALIDGDGLAKIARQWNAAGMLTTFGNEYNSKSVRKILLRPRNAGLVAHKGEILDGVVGQWEALVTVDQWRAAKQIILSHNQGKRTVTKHYLTNLLTCGRCGSQLAATTAQDRRRKFTTYAIYRCTNNRVPGSVCALSIRREAAEQVVRDHARMRLTFEDSSTLSPSSADTARAEVIVSDRAAIAGRVTDLEDLFGTGDISVPSYRKQRVALTEQVDALTAELGEIHQRNAVAEVLAQKIGVREDPLGNAVAVTKAFDALDIERRRTVIRALFGSIVVHPVGRSAPRGPDAAAARMTFTLPDGSPYVLSDDEEEDYA